ncbi:hypothetical protein [Aliterella atlantica]|uniref:hypothetical protein n=1 Tax=Aliterella atlantica TaxID=1827278 RepID=UPI001184F5AE
MANFDPRSIHKRSIVGISQDVASGQWSLHFRKKNRESIDISDSDAIVLHSRLDTQIFVA